MIGEMICVGPFSIPKKVKNCLCPDGIRRMVYITGEPDTFFSIPAKLNYKGKYTAGFVTSFDNNNDRDYKYVPYDKYKSFF